MEQLLNKMLHQFMSSYLICGPKELKVGDKIQFRIRGDDDWDEATYTITHIVGNRIECNSGHFDRTHKEVQYKVLNRPRQCTINYSKLVKLQETLCS